MAKHYAALTRGLTAVVVREAAAIVGETERTLRKHLAAGRYPLLAGPQARMRVLLPTDLVATQRRRHQEAGGSEETPPAATPPLVRYAMTPEAVAQVADQVADRVARRHAAALTRTTEALQEQYAARLAAQERALAMQARATTALEERLARAEARAEHEARQHQALQERLVALVEAHASRSLVGQVGRLLQGERG